MIISSIKIKKFMSWFSVTEIIVVILIQLQENVVTSGNSLQTFIFGNSFCLHKCTIRKILKPF